MLLFHLELTKNQKLVQILDINNPKKVSKCIINNSKKLTKSLHS
jgi:hypothetical protein